MVVMSAPSTTRSHRSSFGGGRTLSICAVLVGFFTGRGGTMGASDMVGMNAISDFSTMTLIPLLGVRCGAESERVAGTMTSTSSAVMGRASSMAVAAASSARMTVGARANTRDASDRRGDEGAGASSGAVAATSGTGGLGFGGRGGLWRGVPTGVGVLNGLRERILQAVLLAELAVAARRVRGEANLVDVGHRVAIGVEVALGPDGIEPVPHLDAVRHAVGVGVDEGVVGHPLAQVALGEVRQAVAVAVRRAAAEGERRHRVAPAPVSDVRLEAVRAAGRSVH